MPKEAQERGGVKISLTVLESQLNGIRGRVKLLLEEGVRRRAVKCAGLLKYEAQLWTFTGYVIKEVLS